jgi:hypothetical protein
MTSLLILKSPKMREIHLNVALTVALTLACLGVTSSSIAAPPQTNNDPTSSSVQRTIHSSTGDATSGGSTTGGSTTGGSTTGDAAAGGAAFADFDSLMQLIQSTIAPDSWEELGGSGTMAPYPQGIFVDAQGIVRDCEIVASDNALSSLKADLWPTKNPSPIDPKLSNDSIDWRSVRAPDDWRRPSLRRVVSLGRLFEQVSARLNTGVALDQSMLNLAGLSQIEHIVLVDHDVWIVGSIGGIEDHQGWWVDLKTRRVPMQLDYLSGTCSSVRSRQSFGCTIDPTQKGLAAAAGIASEVKSDRLPIGLAADRMSQALGLQKVHVFGIAGDSPLAYRMVHADRHMKELALGIHPMPEGVPSYLDQITRHISAGAPTDLLLRLWFTSKPISVRSDSARTMFSISGRPVRLSCENQIAGPDGTRGAVTRDVRSQDFVEAFNENWSSIANQYPVYGSIESLFTSASLSAILDQFGGEDGKRMVDAYANLHLHEQVILQVPRQIESIAVLHNARKGNKRHHVLIASGGVSVDPKHLIRAEPEIYPSLATDRVASDLQPKVIQKWWWDESANNAR